MLITADQVRKIGDNRSKTAIVAALADFITNEGDNHELDTALRCSYFLGHCAVESSGFSALEENLNYSAKGLMRVWPKRFPNSRAAAPYVGNPQALANYTYGGRMGNRPGTNDGWDFRGRGLKQLTGRDNYTRFTKWAQKNYPGAPDFVKNPSAVLLMPWALLSAVWFWETNDVYKYADNDDTKGSTLAINGGYTGLNDRIIKINLAKKLLNPQPAAVKTLKPTKKTGGADPVVMDYQKKLNQIADYKDKPDYNVGKADGWMGKKTEDAVKAFQKDTDGLLEVDGVLGDETKEAIDNVVAVIETGKVSSLAEDLTPESNKEIVVDTQPVPVPTRLMDTLDKSVIQNKSLWAYITGGGGFVTFAWNAGVAWFQRQGELVQVALIVLFGVTLVLAFFSIRDFFRARKGLKELKINNAAAQQQMDDDDDDAGHLVIDHLPLQD